MIKSIEDKLDKIPIINLIVRFLKKIKLPGLKGLSVYDLIEMYIIGIAKGALTSRASAITFSFFTAIFPFLIFVLILIPYVPLEDFGYIGKNQGKISVLISKYLFFIAMIYISTATLYYFGAKEGKLSSFFSIGVLFTTLLIIITSYLFGIYTENFSQYNELYGSIGALLILLLYLWLNANILLLGFELNASLQRLKQRF